MEARLHTELPGILASAMRRLPGLLARGQFALTDSAREARAEFERRTDQVRYWLHECCARGDYAPVPRNDLYRAYQSWTIRDGGKAMRASQFYERLGQAACGKAAPTSGRRAGFACSTESR